MNSNISTKTPDSGEMFSRFRSESWSLALFILAILLTLLTVCLYIETLIVLLKKFDFGARRGFVIFLSGLIPVQSVCSLISLGVPSASFTSKLVAEMYLGMCLYVTIMYMIDMFGGVDLTLRALSNQKTSLRQPPCCCCCICFPFVTLQTKSFGILRLGILQYIFVIPIAVLIPAVYWVDDLIRSPEESIIFQQLDVCTSVIKMASTLTAVYSLSVLIKIVQTPLSPFYAFPQFGIIRAVLALDNLQGFILLILVRSGFTGCLKPLTCNSFLVSKIILNLLLILEMLPLMILCRIVMGRWIRSGTHKQCYGEINGTVEGDKHSTVESHDNASFTFQRLEIPI